MRTLLSTALVVSIYMIVLWQVLPRCARWPRYARYGPPVVFFLALIGLIYIFLKDTLL